MAAPTWLLYDNPLSGNCWKARQVLTSARVPFRTEEVSVLGDREADRRDTPVGRHHAGRIPLLVGPDGIRLAESNAILMWFGEDAGLYPADRLARHRVHEWLFFEQSMHMPSLASARYLTHVIDAADAYVEVLEFLRARGQLALVRMEKRLADPEAGGWLASGACSVADVALYPYTRMAHHGGFELEGFPAVRAWLARVEAREDFVPLPCL